MKPSFPIMTVAIAAVVSISASNAKTAEPAGGPPGSWVLIGSSKATHTNDHDTIEVVGRHDTFRRLKVAVDGASLHMQRMTVTYGDGGTYNIPVRYDIQKGSETRAIELNGARRTIRKVDFWYDTKGWLHGTASVRLYGMH